MSKKILYIFCTIMILVSCGSKEASNNSTTISFEQEYMAKEEFEAKEEVDNPDTIQKSEYSIPIYSDYDLNDEVKLLGFYSNEESFDGEHSTGYFIHLWSTPNKLVGKLTFTEGLIGSGTAEWITNGERKEDSIYFNSNVYDIDVQFKGILSDTVITGDFIWGNGTVDSVQELEKCCVDAPTHKDYSNLKAMFEEWKKM